MRGYEVLTGSSTGTTIALRIPMRGYELDAASLASSIAWLRIPMRGYEKYTFLSAGDCCFKLRIPMRGYENPWLIYPPRESQRYESPCGVMRAPTGSPILSKQCVTNPHAGL